MRNLARLRTAGIRAPRPLQLRAHVLVMEFVGAGGVAAPRLKARAAPCRSAASAPMPSAVQALLCAPSTRVRSRGAASGRIAAAWARKSGKNVELPKASYAHVLRAWGGGHSQAAAAAHLIASLGSR